MTIDKEFMDQLAEKYDSLGDGGKSWEKEKDKIRDILTEVRNNIASRYDIDVPINIGGTAIVIKVIDKNLNIPHALKCARPIEGKESLLANILSSEISRLRESTHPNIMPVFYFDKVRLFDEEWPYYVMEYVEGAVDAYDYLEIQRRDYKTVVDLVKQCVDGLVFLHTKNTIHGDIKLENLLVSPNGAVKISDLGSARLLLPGREDLTRITCTREFAHPELRQLLYEFSETDSNRVSAQIERSRLKKVFDLYALGKNIYRTLKKYDIAEVALLPIYYRSYLELMAARMLDGHNLEEECALNLPRSAFTEIRYQSAAEIADDIRKITGEYVVHNEIPELDHHFQRTIQISAPVSTPFTKRVANILASPLIRRLSSVSQLGLIVQIYPTATHTRLEHVLGTYSNVTRYCDALWHDQINPLFRQIMTEHDLSLILLASLCHDIGQYALAHDLEEAENHTFSHKTIGAKLLTNWDTDESKALKETMKREWGVDANEIANLLNTDPTDLSQPLKYRLLVTLLDSPLDADKVDYLIRDSINLNVPYGKVIDVERLLRCLTTVFKQEAMRTFITLGIHEKGKIPAEALAFSRYAMFGTVYWHHTSRSLKSMLHRAAWETLPSKDRRSSEYRSFQNEFYDEVLKHAPRGQYITGQLGFFPPKTELLETPQLSQNDWSILSWMHSKTSPAGKKLIEMICERVLFKRVIVISHRKNPKLWDKLTDLRRTYPWHVLLEFQKYFQENMIGLIDNIDDEKRKTTTILSKERTDEIVAMNARGDILFLIDIPGERRGSSFDLYFLPEVRTHGTLSTNYQDAQVEDSLTWTQLSNNFLKSVGKIRVFCHPAIIETCTAGLDREQIDGTIETSHRYVTR